MLSISDICLNYLPTSPAHEPVQDHPIRDADNNAKGSDKEDEDWNSPGDDNCDSEVNMSLLASESDMKSRQMRDICNIISI